MEGVRVYSKQRSFDMPIVRARPWKTPQRGRATQPPSQEEASSMLRAQLEIFNMRLRSAAGKIPLNTQKKKRDEKETVPGRLFLLTGKAAQGRKEGRKKYPKEK